MCFIAVVRRTCRVIYRKLLSLASFRISKISKSAQIATPVSQNLSFEGQVAIETSVRALRTLFTYIPRSPYGSSQYFGVLVELYISTASFRISKISKSAQIGTPGSQNLSVEGQVGIETSVQALRTLFIYIPLGRCDSFSGYELKWREFDVTSRKLRLYRS